MAEGGDETTAASWEPRESRSSPGEEPHSPARGQKNRLHVLQKLGFLRQAKNTVSREALHGGEGRT